ncbi:MAG: hypothetical protein ACK5O5_01525, partial [bacterium]
DDQFGAVGQAAVRRAGGGPSGSKATGSSDGGGQCCLMRWERACRVACTFLVARNPSMTSQNCRRVRIRLLGCPRRVDRPEQCTWVGVQLRPPSSPKSPFSSKAYAAVQGKSRGGAKGRSNHVSCWRSPGN